MHARILGGEGYPAESRRGDLLAALMAIVITATEDHDHKNDDMVNPTIFSNTEALIFGCDSPTMTCKLTI